MGDGSLRRLGGAGALLLATALIALAWTIGGLAARGWALTGGFAVLTAALILFRVGAVPSGFAGLFTILGGLSAVVAAGAPAPLTDPLVKSLARIGMIRETPSEAVPAFHYALRVTTLGALAACASATAVTLWMRQRPQYLGRSQDRPASLLVERLGQVLCLMGLVGFALAFLRFGLVSQEAPTLFGQLKSFWRGGTYLLLVAGFAIPGIGLWLSAAMERGDHRSTKICAGLAGLLVLLSIPTGQRGFFIILAVVVIAVLVGRRAIPVRGLAGLAVAGFIAIAVTQAARIAVLEQGSVTPGAVASRLAPDRWRDLLGNQIESFRWTWDVAHYRDRLDLPGPVRSLISKPVPRALNPGKTQGFASDFTKALYPDAASDEVSFATPLVAEIDYVWGPSGVLIVFAMFAGMAAWLWQHFRKRGAVLRPILLTALGWCCLLYVRGDVANATVIAASWVVPLAAVLIALHTRPRWLTDLLLSERGRLRRT